ncbi:MAG: tRNA (adenosine(37)-N6)-threonylcarbamoyltransferase complex dimerization subunit type 1 TsaB [Gemmataceae bacterium]
MTRLLLIETSHRRGWVALAQSETVLGHRDLEESRRHGRDLVPFAKELLDEHDWKARDLEGVAVDRGPGSYTGLRVGIISAKTLAYAVGCPLVAFDAFEAVATQTEADVVDAIADAQQDKVYVQRFCRTAEGMKPATDLAIMPIVDWLAQLEPGQTVNGPGLEIVRDRLPSSIAAADEALRTPQPATVVRLAMNRLRTGTTADPYGLEPLYLRASSAEENWKKS